MVLRKFSSEALDSLCTREQLELLNSIDTLRSQGINHYVSLPQIIVCGDQSSGKSSVLEAISGVSFPVKSNLCTRFPTELVLRKTPNVGVRVSIAPHHSRTEVERQSLESFCEELDSFDGLPQLIDNAKAAMGISTLGKAFSNDLLRVEVSGPDRPHLTIVDLPGLIHSETKHQSAADVQLVQDVVQAYMREPRSIILAVVSAKNDPANQIVLRLAKDADKSGDRTLGVITKPDTLVPNSKSESTFIALANNRDVEFRHGWHTLRNMDSDQGNWTLADRNKEECAFFAQGAWREMPSFSVGIVTLRDRLSKLLLRQIVAELPGLITEIKDKEDDCIERLAKLGQPRTTLDEQKAYLLNISQYFQSLVKAAVDGTYNEAFFENAESLTGRLKRLRAVVQNLNERFADRLSRLGHYRKIAENNNPAGGLDGQVSVTRSEFINHIQDLMKRTRGRELPGTFNPMIIGELFAEQCRPWEAITRQHIIASWQAVKTFLSLLICHISDEATSGILFNEVISPALDQVRENLIDRSEELLGSHRKGHPITYNHYFTETLQEIRAERREGEISRIIQEFFEVSDLQTPQYLEDTYALQDLLKNLLLSSEPDMIRFASAEALDCMLAYYKVALKRFIDDVAVEVVEAKLVQSLTCLLTPVKVFEMPSELVSRIAGESEENCAVRQQLNRKLQILRKGLETCRQFVGSREVGTNKNIIEAHPPTDGAEGQDVHSLPEIESVGDDSWDGEVSSPQPQPLDPNDDYPQCAEEPSVMEHQIATPETGLPEEETTPQVKPLSRREKLKLERRKRKQYPGIIPPP